MIFLLLFCSVVFLTGRVHVSMSSMFSIISTQVKTKDLKNCTKEMVIEYHNKTIYDCKNVTKRHCTTLWTVNDAGDKVNLKMNLLLTFLVIFQVWAGNEDDCRDVTWEECNPPEKKVKPLVICFKTH